MLQMIKNEPSLEGYLHCVIEDAGLIVQVSPNLPIDKFVAIKIDDFYSNLRLGNETPKSIDFLISVDCECDYYVLYLLELKNVSSPSGIITSDIKEKFDTTIENFIKQRFSNIFLADRFKYRYIFLYLVSDAYNIAGKFSSHSAYKDFLEKTQRILYQDTLKVDYQLSQKLYKIRNRILQIKYVIPSDLVVQRFL